MPSGNNTTIILIIGAILLITFFYLFKQEPIHNEGALQTKQSLAESREYDNDSSLDSSQSAESSVDESSMSQSEEIDSSVDSSVEVIRDRAMGLNGPEYRRRNGNKYKQDSYRALGENTNYNQVDKQFDVPDVSKNFTDRFVPSEEDGNHATVNIKNNKGTDAENYDSNQFLPQEKEKDWFETIETVDVKNSNLINIYRPIGVNTIGSTHKNAIYDIRGTDKAVCPKFVVSPWLQSSYEPDRSSKSLC